MKPLTDKQKKAAWIVGAVLVIAHFTPALVSTVRQQMTEPHRGPAKPSAAIPMPPAPAIALSSANVFMQTHAGYIGVWKLRWISHAAMRTAFDGSLE